MTRAGPKVFAACLLIFGLLYTLYGLQWPMFSDVGRIFTGFYPRIVGLTLTVVGAWNLYDVFRVEKAREAVAAATGEDADRTSEVEKEEGSRGFARQALVVSLASVAYLAAFFTIGPFLATVVFMTFLLAVLDSRPFRWPWIATTSVLIATGIYLTFFVWLNITPPETPLW